MTDTSNDVVARLCLTLINSGNTTTANMLTALADERDRLETAHTKLQASLSAANARADQARDAALVEAAGTLEDQALDAEAQAKRFRGGSDPWADRTARSRALRNSAAAILALRDKPAPGVTVQGVAKAIFDASTFYGDWEGQPQANVEVCEDMARAALRAIAGGGDE